MKKASFSRMFLEAIIGVSALTLSAARADGQAPPVQQSIYYQSAIFFDRGSTQISPAGHMTISIAARLHHSASADAALFIFAHSDQIGSGNSNRALSTERARSVVQALVVSGVPPSRILGSSCGEAYASDLGSPNWQDRRVEVFVALKSVPDVLPDRLLCVPVQKNDP